jgi:sugar O-acyltransferase (sialic acid O-acetyltransferase NeuD family)
MSRLVCGVYGVGGYGREVMPIVRAQLADVAAAGSLYFVDDRLSGTVVNGHSVVSYENFRKTPADERRVVIAVADAMTRRALAERCEADGLGFQSITAQNAVVLDDVSLGAGYILNSFVTITSNVRIGRYFQANLYAYVAHDCVIGDFVTFAPGVMCNGNVVVEDDAYIGTGAVLKQGTSSEPLVIGAGAVVGMGAVVTKSVPPGKTVVGNPARLLVRD